MKKRTQIALVGSAIAFGLTTLTAATAGPPDEKVSKGVREYLDYVEQGRQSGRFTKNELSRAANDSVKGLEIDSMSVDQIAVFDQAQIWWNTHRVHEFNRRLTELAEQRDVEGARAAVMRMNLLRNEREFNKQVELLQTAFRHPGLRDSLMNGYCTEIFITPQGASSGALKEVRSDLLNMALVLSPEMSPRIAAFAPQYMEMLMRVTAENDFAAREPVRRKFSRLIANAQPKVDSVDQQLYKRLQTADTVINSAFMRGELINSPAPELDFVWTSKGDFEDLEDMRGKVVVLDFWASWCSPCIASFADFGRLNDYYEGYAVEFIGVTSFQGKFRQANGNRVVTANDPTTELALMKDFIQDRNIDWIIGFTSQDVFNPEFGVRGIPHMSMIDVNGKIRFNNIDPNDKGSSFESKVRMINTLLKEAGRAAPSENF